VTPPLKGAFRLRRENRGGGGWERPAGGVVQGGGESGALPKKKANETNFTKGDRGIEKWKGLKWNEKAQQSQRRR